MFVFFPRSNGRKDCHSSYLHRSLIYASLLLLILSCKKHIEHEIDAPPTALNQKVGSDDIIVITQFRESTQLGLAQDLSVGVQKANAPSEKKSDQSAPASSKDHNYIEYWLPAIVGGLGLGAVGIGMYAARNISAKPNANPQPSRSPSFKQMDLPSARQMDLPSMKQADPVGAPKANKSEPFQPSPSRSLQSSRTQESIKVELETSRTELQDFNLKLGAVKDEGGFANFLEGLSDGKIKLASIERRQFEQIQQDLLDWQDELAQMHRHYGADDPRFRQVQEHIDDLIAKRKDALESAINARQAEISQLNGLSFDLPASGKQSMQEYLNSLQKEVTELQSLLPAGQNLQKKPSDPAVIHYWALDQLFLIQEVIGQRGAVNFQVSADLASATAKKLESHGLAAKVVRDDSSPIARVEVKNTSASATRNQQTASQTSGFAKEKSLDSRGILGGDKLPPSSGLELSAQGLVRSTKSLAEYKPSLTSPRERAFKQKLQQDGVSHITQVAGDGNCGFYSVHAAQKLDQGGEIRWGGKDVTEEVDKMKAGLKEHILRNLEVERNHIPNIDSRDLTNRVANSLARAILERPKGGFLADDLQAVSRAEKFIKENRLSGDNADSMRREALKVQTNAELFSKHGSEIDDLLKDFEITDDREVDVALLTFRLRDNPNIGRLYNQLVIDESGLKVDPPGLKVLARNELDRPIFARSIEAMDTDLFFDSTGIGKDPIYLVNSGGHWELGHLPPKKMDELLSKLLDKRKKDLSQETNQSKVPEKQDSLNYMQRYYDDWRQRNAQFL